MSPFSNRSNAGTREKFNGKQQYCFYPNAKLQTSKSNEQCTFVKKLGLGRVFDEKRFGQESADVTDRDTRALRSLCATRSRRIWKKHGDM